MSECHEGKKMVVKALTPCLKVIVVALPSLLLPSHFTEEKVVCDAKSGSGRVLKINFHPLEGVLWEWNGRRTY